MKEIKTISTADKFLILFSPGIGGPGGLIAGIPGCCIPYWCCCICCGC